MNFRMISQVLGRVVALEAMLLLIPMVVSVGYGEHFAHFAITSLIALTLAGFLMRWRPTTRDFYARDGFVTVAASWVTLSLIGALPFALSGEIPNYIDAVFETISGFTTTGASIVPDVEALSHGIHLWRVLTIWVGGMGVLVFVMFVVPLSEEHSMHIMRAEMPGPTIGKLVPRIRNTAMLLYVIYAAMTVLMVLLLRVGGLNWFDSFIHALSTAGTGGFSNYGSSVAAFNSPYLEAVVGVFALLFGVNFNMYYFILIRRFRDILHNGELWAYIAIVAAAILTMTVSLTHFYGSALTAFRYAGFQVASIITTTGHVTANYDLWPMYPKFVLFLLMIIGGCAGSTSGGIKISRVLILMKTVRNEIHHQNNPRAIHVVRLNDAPISRDVQHSTLIFLALYLLLILGGTLLLTLNDMDFTSTFTAVVSCTGNVGPAFGIAGPVGSYSGFSYFSKLVLSVCMLMGRLEILPIVMLISPSTWRRSA